MNLIHIFAFVVLVFGCLFGVEGGVLPAPVDDAIIAESSSGKLCFSGNYERKLTLIFCIVINGK